MTFLELGLCSNICEIMQKLEFAQPTEVQQRAIPVILFGKDVIVRSETGSGKTFAFILPISQRIDVKNQNVQALIICPTRELAMQVADETKKVAEDLGIGVCAVFGGSNIDRQVSSLKKKPQIVIGTTGRIIDLIKKKALKIHDTNFIVLDEADEMLDMGFKPDIEKILSHTKKDRQTLMFSATIPDEIKELASRYQKDEILIEIGTANKALNTINQNYIYVSKKQKQNLLAELLWTEIYDKAIVFVNTKIFAEDLESFLLKKKISCGAIHGDMKQSERKRVLNSFKDGKIEILIATDVAARGLDIKDVKYIINFDLPHETEFYVHRIGRTARAGKSGTVINIITSLEQLSYMRDIEKETNAKINLYQTKNVNLLAYYVDTKKLAKQNNRFSKKSERVESFRKQSEDNKRKSRYAIFSTFDDDMFDDYYGDVEFKDKKFSKLKNKNAKQRFEKYDYFDKHKNSESHKKLKYENNNRKQNDLNKLTKSFKQDIIDDKERKERKNSKYKNKLSKSFNQSSSSKQLSKIKKQNSSVKWFSKFTKK